MDDVMEVNVADEKALTAPTTSITIPHGGSIQLRNLEEYLKFGEVLYKSGYFSDIKSAAQAVVKMVAGAEMGFGPMASLNGVYIQGGRPSFMANLVASAIKRNGYDYTIDVLDNTECKVTFHSRGGKLLGVSHFTMADAVQAGLTTGSNAHSWKKFPRNMLFSRALTNGARWYTPDIFGGVTPYTPDELDMVIDGSTGELKGKPDDPSITSPNGQPESPEPEPAPQPTPKPEPQPVPEPVVVVKTVKYWDGTQWVQMPENGVITDGKLVHWFNHTFIKDGKTTDDKRPIGAIAHMVNHLKAHYQYPNGQPRMNIIDAKNGSMPNRDFSELVGYCWWAMGDHEHGWLEPTRYKDKLAKEMDAHPAPAPVVAGLTHEGVLNRANGLRVTIVGVAGKVYGIEKWTDVTPDQLMSINLLLDAVEKGYPKYDDVDEMIALLKTG